MKSYYIKKRKKERLPGDYHYLIWKLKRKSKDLKSSVRRLTFFAVYDEKIDVKETGLIIRTLLELLK